MGNIKFQFILLVLASIGCGRFVPVAQSIPTEDIERKKVIAFEGKFIDLQQEVIDLSLTTRPFVLIFASDTCTVCTKETRHLVQLFNDTGRLPSNVDLMTVLIGASLQDAVDWSDLHQVPWLVGTDSGDSLFRKHCPEQKTPCVLTYVPENGQLSKFVGGTSTDELEKETGKWRY